MTPDKFYHDQTVLPWQHNLLQNRLFSSCIEISRRSFRKTGSFRGRAIEWRQTNSTTTNPRCHGNEIWNKIGYNSACVRDTQEIFAYNRGFSWSCYWMTPDKFYHDQPPLPWQRNLGQNRLYLGLYKRNFGDLCVQQGFLGSGYRMTPDKFYHDRPTLPCQRNVRQNRL